MCAVVHFQTQSKPKKNRNKFNTNDVTHAFNTSDVTHSRIDYNSSKVLQVSKETSVNNLTSQ